MIDLQTITDMITSLKRIINQNQNILLPIAGESDKIELKGTVFAFWVDINRKGRKKGRCTMQLREKQYKDQPLLRLDLVGPPHPNPPGNYGPLAGQTIPCPHLHIAHPDFGDSIAYPLDSQHANMLLTDDELKDIAIILQRFLERCNVGNIKQYTYQSQGNLF